MCCCCHVTALRQTVCSACLLWCDTSSVRLPCTLYPAPCTLHSAPLSHHASSITLSPQPDLTICPSLRYSGEVARPGDQASGAPLVLDKLDMLLDAGMTGGEWPYFIQVSGAACCRC